MALTKTFSAITQVTATGTSTTIDIAASYDSEAYIRHDNGTGTPSTAAEIQVQVKPDGSSNWIDHLAPIKCSLVAADEQDFLVLLPRGGGDVQFVYTAPGTSTGYTLDAEVSLVTAH